MGYPTQFSMSGKLKGDIEYHTSILHDEINFDWSKIEFKYQNEPIFFHLPIQVPLHGKFETRKLMACLDPEFRIAIQYQNIVHVVNEHENLQPKLRMLKEVTDGDDYNINDMQSDMNEELIYLETHEIVLN